MKFNKRFFRKFFLVSGGLLLAVFAILAVTYTVLNIIWGSKLRNELDKLKTAGTPMTIEEIAPPPLAPAENASAEYLQIFSLMTDGTFSSSNNSGKPNKDFLELENLCVSSKDMEGGESPYKSNSERINEILDSDSFKHIFGLCQEASAKPGLNFNRNYDEGPGLMLPDLNIMRRLARILYVKAEMEILAGKREKAWDTILTGLKLSSQLKTEPILISQLVYRAINNIYFDFISYNLPRYGISKEQAEKIMSELAPEKTAYTESMKKAVVAERICSGGWVFERLLSGRLNLSDLNAATSSGSAPLLKPLMYLYRPYANKDYMEYLKIMEEYRNDYDQPYFKLATKSSKDMAKRFASKYFILTRMLCPAIVEIRLKTAEIETFAREIRIRLALEEYKDIKGTYPEKLDQLSPQFIPEISVSEVTGRPFEYSKEKNGYKFSGGVSSKKEDK